MKFNRVAAYGVALSALPALLLVGGCDVEDGGGLGPDQEVNGTSAPEEGAAENDPGLLARGPERERQAERRAERPRGETKKNELTLPLGDDEQLKIERELPEQVRRGSELSYTIKVTNVSDVPLHGVVLAEFLHGPGLQAPAPQQQSQLEQREGAGSVPAGAPRGEAGEQRAGMPRQQREQAEEQQQQQQDAQKEQNQQQQDAQKQQNQQQQDAQKQQNQQQQDAQKQQNQQQQDAQKRQDAQKQQEAQQQQQQQGGAAPEGGEEMGEQSLGGLWRIGTLQPGETREIPVKRVVRGEGELNSCIIADYRPALCGKITVAAPELELTRVFVNEDNRPVDVVFACDEAYALYRVSNPGTGELRDVTVSEDLPRGFTADGEQRVEFKIDRLAGGDTEEKRVKLDFNDQVGQIAGTATARSGELQAYSGEGGLRVVRPTIAMRLQGPQTAYAGEPISYDLIVQNASQDAPAARTQVQLDLPEGAERIRIYGQGAEREGDVIRFGTLRPGEQRVVRLQFVPGRRATGSLAVRARAEAYCAPPAQAEAALQIEGIPAVQIEVIDGTDPVRVGQETAYSIRVINEGTAEAMQVQLVGELPQGLEFLEGGGDTDVSGQGGQLRFGALDRLAPGEDATWWVRVRANQSGRAGLKLSMTSDANPEPVVEEEPTNVYGGAGERRGSQQQQQQQEQQELPQQQPQGGGER